MRRAIGAVFVIAGLFGVAGVGAARNDLPPVQAVAVGDFDGDGVPDVAVGLPEVNVGRVKKAGQVRVYSGKTGKLIATASGTEKEEEYGGCLAAVGDVDGDGATDLAAGAPYAEASRVDILSGKTGKRIRKCSGGSVIGWGDDLCALGDGSGRRRVDLVVCASVKRKWYYVYTDKEAVGGSYRFEAGFTVTACYVGDVNGDRAPDFALANWNVDVKGVERAGRIKVISGAAIRTSGSHELLVIEGKRAGGVLGIVMAPAGDWNGDGHADFLAGSPGIHKKSNWQVTVFSGKDGSELWGAEGKGKEFSMGGIGLVGDMDDDGKPDVAIGTPGLMDKKPGAVRVYAAKDATVLWTVEGVKRENLGVELYPIPDADADGVADLVVLAPNAAVGGKRGNGYVRLLSGKTGKVITYINPLRAK